MRGLSRRTVLQGGVLGLLASSLAGCATVARHAAGTHPPSRIQPVRQDHPNRRLLERLAFGATADEIERLEEIGHAAYLEEQLKAERPHPLGLQLKLQPFDIQRADGYELGDLRSEHALAQLQRIALLQAVYSPNQLEERMVDFWSNHFAIFAPKGRGAILKVGDDRDVIRRHALGRFRDLLEASATSPAMLAFLDNHVNTKGAPNENYARELLELHTLGVDGGYTQDDVMEVARCFTGWGIEERPPHAQLAAGLRPYDPDPDRRLLPRGRFRFDPTRHDHGEKIVLGHRIPAGGGRNDIRLVLDLLARHPSTARFISHKLVNYFAGSNHPELETQATATFVNTDGDLRQTIRTIVGSSEILTAKPLVKRPLDFVVSALRVTYAESDVGSGILEHMRRMGQPLHEWPMPDGYPNGADEWSGSLLARWNFALALSRNAIPGTTIDYARLTQALPHSSEPTAWTTWLTGVSILVLSGEGPRDWLALSLSAPEFQWR